MTTKISAFRVDSNAMEEGRWEPLGEDYGDVRVKVRGLTDAYFDAQATAQRRAVNAKQLSNAEALPVATRRAINAQCVVNHVFLDVENLLGDDDKPVTKEQFAEFLVQRDYSPLLQATFMAATRVGTVRKTDLDEAVGNSRNASASSSTGEKTPPTT